MTVVGLRGPRPLAAVKSILELEYFSPGKTLGSSDSLTRETSPSKIQRLLSHTSPEMVSREQLARLGIPLARHFSNCCTNLYVLGSRVTRGATPLQTGLREGRKARSMTYASERRRRRSSH